MDRHLTFTVDYAHFFGGEFLKQTTTGKDVDYFQSGSAIAFEARNVTRNPLVRLSAKNVSKGVGKVLVLVVAVFACVANENGYDCVENDA